MAVHSPLQADRGIERRLVLKTKSEEEEYVREVRVV